LNHLKTSGKYNQTIIIYLSDNGAPFPGSKTTLYEPGIHLPFIIKLPKPCKTNFVQNAMISWVDITPTLLDFVGALPDNVQFQGRSFKSILEQENVFDHVEVYASHSLHEIMMYYPMRVLREKRYKLIYNIAHELQYPQALDLYQSYTWQSLLHSKAKNLGKRSVEAYLHRPKFEMYDIIKDPEEIHNLAADPKYKQELTRMQEKLKRFQKNTHDMWLSKWEFE
jgi:N-sulfoglucosamine sulfohydrolase